MWRLAKIEGSMITWSQVLERMEAMKARVILSPIDDSFLEQARELAGGGA